MEGKWHQGRQVRVVANLGKGLWQRLEMLLHLRLVFIHPLLEPELHLLELAQLDRDNDNVLGMSTRQLTFIQVQSQTHLDSLETLVGLRRARALLLFQQILEGLQTLLTLQL